MLIQKLFHRFFEETNGAGSDLGGTASGDTGSVNWDALDAEITASENGEDVPAVAPAAPPTPSTPEPSSPPAVEAAPVTPPVQPLPPAETVAPAAASPDVPAAPSAPEVSFDQLRAQEQVRLEQVYAIDEATSATLLTEPEKVLPRLAAQIHTAVLESAVQAIVAHLPSIMQAQTERATANTQAEQAFYSQWPGLNKPEYKQTVWQAVAAYKTLNPSAPRDEVIRAAGLQAMLSLRLPLPRELMQFVDPPAAPVQPASFVPASPVAPGMGTPPAPSSGNPFETLASEFLMEDRG